MYKKLFDLSSTFKFVFMIVTLVAGCVFSTFLMDRFFDFIGVFDLISNFNFAFVSFDVESADIASNQGQEVLTTFTDSDTTYNFYATTTDIDTEVLARRIGSGLATAGLGGVGTGIGLVFSGLIKGFSRNPSLKDDLFSYAIFGFALTEAIGLFALMMAFMLLYA